MPITHISSVSQLELILRKSENKLTVIDFHATWCGPCHAIAPAFESLATQYSNVNFLKCDVDAAADVASKYSVSAMPTFIFLKGSVKVDQVRGANKAALEDAIRRHSTSSASGSRTFSGKGQTLGGSPAPADPGRTAREVVNGVGGVFSNMDPQLRIFLAILGAYVVFCYLS